MATADIERIRAALRLIEEEMTPMARSVLLTVLNEEEERHGLALESKDPYEVGYRDGESSGSADWSIALDEELPEGIDLDTESPRAVAQWLAGLLQRMTTLEGFGVNWRSPDVELYAYIGLDEMGTGKVGLKQGYVPAGLIPLVAIDREKLDRRELQDQLQLQVNEYGHPITLTRFVAVEDVLTITPDD